MLQLPWTNYLLWRSRFLQSSSSTISMVLQLCLKIMLINRLKLRVIKTTLCSCNLMVKMSIENSLSNNSELYYFEREFNQIQVPNKDQMNNHPCDSALHIMTYKGQSVDFLHQWTILQASSEVPSSSRRKNRWAMNLCAPVLYWSVDLMPIESPVLLPGTLNSLLRVLSCLKIKTFRWAR